MNQKIFFKDLQAGAVVFLVAMPLCLGISLACGVPLISGIISGIIGGIVTTLISRSKLSVSGPAAGLTVIIITSLATLGSFEYLLAAIFFAGIFQILFGLIKAGNIANFLPNSVIKGMLAGIGLIIILKQLPHLVGYDIDPEGNMEFEQSDGRNSLSDLYFMFRYITPGSCVIGIISLFVIIITSMNFYKKNKILSAFPGPVMVVILGILLNILFQNYEFLKIEEQHLVNLPFFNSLEDFKHIILPDFGKIYMKSFWFVALTIAVVASLETLINIEAVEKLDPEKNIIHPSTELVAQGVGNALSGLFGGLPITSVIVRTSANIDAGAKTKVSAIFHAILLIVSVLFLPHILRLIPNSALAVILITTGYKLAKIELFKQQYKLGWDQFVPFLSTVIFMLLTDLLKGVAAGLVVAIIFIIRNNIKSSFEIIEEVIDGKNTHLIKLPQHITFFNKGFLISYLGKLEGNTQVIIDGSITKTTDKDVREVLLDFKENAKTKNIELLIVNYSI